MPSGKKSKFFNCCVVSAVPPRNDGSDLDTVEAFSNSLLSIVAAPLIHGIQAHTDVDVTELCEVPPIIKNTILIIGAWGYGTNLGHVEVSKAYADLLAGEATSSRVRIGNVYREIHFCFPLGNAGERAKKSLRAQLQSKEIYLSEEA